jgi:integrase
MADLQPVPAPFAGPPASVGVSETDGTTAAALADLSMLHWERALDAWMDHLDSEATRRAYAATLRLLFTTPGIVPFMEEVTPDLLAAWRGALVRRADLPPGSGERIAPATVNRHLAAARAFFSFWRGLGHVRFHADEQALALKPLTSRVERPYQVLEPAEIGAMLWAARQTGRRTTLGVLTSERVARTPWLRIYRGEDRQLVQRDVAILKVALATGLRVSELAALDVSDLTQMGGAWWIAVRSGKGRKSRQVGLSPDDAAEVLAYIAATGRRFAATADRATPLWLSRRNGRLSSRHVRRLIDSMADLAQARGKIAPGKQISPHALRHTLAIALLRGDPETGRRKASTMEVKAVLGHASLTTTQRYLEHLSREDLADLAPNISAYEANGRGEGSRS